MPAGLRDVMTIAAGSWHTLTLKSNYRFDGFVCFGGFVRFGGFVAPVKAPTIVNTQGQRRRERCREPPA